MAGFLFSTGFIHRYPVDRGYAIKAASIEAHALQTGRFDPEELQLHIREPDKSVPSFQKLRNSIHHPFART